MREGMKRRSFLKLLAFAAALAAAPALALAQAAKARLYPGPIRPLDEDEISKPGPWAG